MNQRWRSIHSTFGVAHLVCNGDDAVAVPPGLVEELRGHENDEGLIRFDIRPCFGRGDKIPVVDGVFSAYLGLFGGMADREPVAILLDLLGRKVRVVLDGESVTAA